MLDGAKPIDRRGCKPISCLTRSHLNAKRSACRYEFGTLTMDVNKEMRAARGSIPRPMRRSEAEQHSFGSIHSTFNPWDQTNTRMGETEGKIGPVGVWGIAGEKKKVDRGWVGVGVQWSQAGRNRETGRDFELTGSNLEAWVLCFRLR